MFELIKTLTELVGPTGQEDLVQDWLADRWRQLGLKVERSPIGNLTAYLGGTGPGMLIAAHADEICFRIRSIDADGNVWLTNNGPPLFIPLGLDALIVTDAGGVRGKFVAPTGHVLAVKRQKKQQEKSSALGWFDFWVDVGVGSREEAGSLGLRPGCPVIWDITTRRIGQNIVGKAMDDRAALAVMTTLAERIDRSALRFEVHFASTVAEEGGLIGARDVAKGFDRAIVLEVGLAGDIPTVDERQMPVKLGAGPVLVHKDSGTFYDRKITRDMERAAEAAGVPVQHAVYNGFGSDGLEFIRQGIPTAMLTFPCRFTHSPCETARESDLKQMSDLIETYLTTDVAAGI